MDLDLDTRQDIGEVVELVLIRLGLYRRNRAHWTVSLTGARCAPGAIPAQPVGDVVWEAIKRAIQRPDALNSEYTRRLEAAGSSNDWELQQKQIGVAIKRTNAQEDRITDAYVNESMDLDRYKAEMEKLRQRRQELERLSLDVEGRARQEETSRTALEHMDIFCNQVAQGLDAMNYEERQQLLRLVVERVTVEGDRVKVDTVIPTDPWNGQLRNARGEPAEPYERRERPAHVLGQSSG